jgi:prepilin-type N-terminal cleavage/methylation domain-containing protein
MDNKQDKGFTLVELLIVIVILGILATVTVFAVRGITDQGQDSACSADTKTMETAVEAYFAQYGGSTIALTLGQQTAAYTAAVAAGDAVALPASGGSTEGTLQAAKLIVDPSGNVDVSTAGDVTFTDPGKCV